MDELIELRAFKAAAAHLGREASLSACLKETREQLVKVRDAIHASGALNNRDKYMSLGLETNTVISRAWHTLNDTGAGERERPCTCHPDDNPPVPCARKYALTECRAAAQSVKPEAAETKAAYDFIVGKSETVLRFVGEPAALAQAQQPGERAHKQLQALWLALDGGPKPFCRDCADHDGNCPSNGLPCDPQERALAQIKTLRATASQVDSGREDERAVIDMLCLCGELGGKQDNETYAQYLRRLIDEIARQAQDCGIDHRTEHERIRDRKL